MRIHNRYVALIFVAQYHKKMFCDYINSYLNSFSFYLFRHFFSQTNDQNKPIVNILGIK